jgi:hypothetical protein
VMEFLEDPRGPHGARACAWRARADSVRSDGAALTQAHALARPPRHQARQHFPHRHRLRRSAGQAAGTSASRRPSAGSKRHLLQEDADVQATGRLRFHELRSRFFSRGRSITAPDRWALGVLYEALTGVPLPEGDHGRRPPTSRSTAASSAPSRVDRAFSARARRLVHMYPRHRCPLQFRAGACDTFWLSWRARAPAHFPLSPPASSPRAQVLEAPPHARSNGVQPSLWRGPLVLSVGTFLRSSCACAPRR